MVWPLDSQRRRNLTNPSSCRAAREARSAGHVRDDVAVAEADTSRTRLLIADDGDGRRFGVQETVIHFVGKGVGSNKARIRHIGQFAVNGLNGRTVGEP